MMFKNYDQFFESSMFSYSEFLANFSFSVSSIENSQELGRFYKFRFRVLVYEDRLIFVTNNLIDPVNDEVLYIDKKDVNFKDLDLIQLRTPSLQGDFTVWFSLDKDSNFSSKASSERFAIQQLHKVFELIDSDHSKLKNDKKVLFENSIFINWWNRKDALRTGMKYGL